METLCEGLHLNTNHGYLKCKRPNTSNIHWKGKIKDCYCNDTSDLSNKNGINIEQAWSTKWAIVNETERTHHHASHWITSPVCGEFFKMIS